MWNGRKAKKNDLHEIGKVNQEGDSTEKRQGDAYQNEWRWCSEELVDYWARETTEDWQVVTGVKKDQVTSGLSGSESFVSKRNYFSVQYAHWSSTSEDIWGRARRFGWKQTRFDSAEFQFDSIQFTIVAFLQAEAIYDKLWTVVCIVKCTRKIIHSYFFEISCKWTVT